MVKFCLLVKIFEIFLTNYIIIPGTVVPDNNVILNADTDGQQAEKTFERRSHTLVQYVL